MTHKISFLLLLFIFLLPSVQCNICNCDPVLNNFDIKGFRLLHETIPGTLSTNNEVAFKNYNWMLFTYDVDYVHTESQDNILNMFQNQAMACDCDLNGFLGARDETIQSFHLITLNDFDQEHLANDTINDLFRLTHDFRDTLDLNAYISRYSTELIPREQFLLLLKKAPELNKEFKVKCILSLSSGEEYETLVPAIQITN